MGLRLQIAVFLLGAASAALGEGISGYVEEDYTHTNTTTDETGRSQRSATDQITQRYRLTLDHGIYPLMRLNVGGVFEQINAWGSTPGVSITAFDRTTSGFANLTLGGTILTGSAGYNYRSEQQTGTPGRLVIEEPSIYFNWRPTDLPSLSLRLARTHLYDTEGLIEDIATWLAQLTATYAPAKPVLLQYAATFANPDDRLHLTSTNSLVQTGRAAYVQTFVEEKASVAADVNLVDQRSQVTSAGTGGTVTQQQSPIAGYSLIETFPSVPSLDTLVANPALIDAQTSASAGIDLGFSVAAAGDVNLRDMGAQFADVLTNVNTLYLWVDRQLTGTVVASFAWTVWQSDDNAHWTQVPVVAPVVFGAFQNRFEITIQQTAGRYLKVVTKPLDPAVTIDRRFSSIFVTELQLLLVTPVTTTHDWQSNTNLTATASARKEFLTPGLAWDGMGIVTHITATGANDINTWLLTNGLGYTRKLSPIFFFNARVARQDADQSRGHEGAFIYSSSLSATPFPTLNHSLVYSGQSTWTQTGFGNFNSVSFFNRATPYRGIGLLAGFVYSLAANPGGTTVRSDSITFNATVQPNPKLTLTGTLGHADAMTQGGGITRAVAVTNRVDGGITFTPVPAIFLAGSLSHMVISGAPRTLANGTASFSPFPGGDLQLALNYLETYQDPGQISRLFIPSLRWNIRPSTLLTLSYTLINTEGGAIGTHTRTFEANFQTAL
jgi:hypothetical protein